MKIAVCSNPLCCAAFDGDLDDCPYCKAPIVGRTVSECPRTRFNSDGNVHKRVPGRVHLSPMDDGRWKSIVTFDSRLRRPSRVTFGDTADAAFDNMISWCDRVCTVKQRAMLRRRP